MATYKGIQGCTVQSRSTDLTASSTTAGQLWYTSDGGKFKIVQEGTAAWSAGGDFNRDDVWASGSCGTQTAGLVATGNPVANDAGATEEYDGSSWTEVADVNTGRYGNGGAGVVTAALTFAGALDPGATAVSGVLAESYNGSTWTEVASMNTARHYVASTNYAPATACICISGSPPPTQNFSEEYDGTSWSELADFNTGRRNAGGAGTTTSAIIFGGKNPSGTFVALAESWNGTSWVEGAALTTARATVGASGESNTSALCYAGETSGGVFTAITEKWNGTSWTEVGDLTSARKYPSSIGTSSVALSGCGSNASGFQGTEEWNDPVYSVKTVTVS